MGRSSAVSRCVLVIVSVATVGVGAIGSAIGAAAPDSGSGEVLVRDDFSDATSGFQVFNAANNYAEYLPDGRFRLGLRAPGSTKSLREEPQGDVVEVSSTVRSARKVKTDAFGLVCDASSDSFFWAGLIRMDGKALIAHFNFEQVDESGALVTFPARLLKKGKRAANEITLKCIPDPNISLTYLELSLNGTVVATLQALGEPTGKTGVFIAAEKAGTQFLFEDFQVLTPTDLEIPTGAPHAVPAGG